MRLVDFLRSLAPLLMAPGIILLASRKRVVRHFESGRAFDATSAIAPPASRFPLIRWWVGRFERAGVLHRTSDDRRWLDQDAWRHYHNVRRRRALILVGCALALSAIAFYLSNRG